MTLGKGLAIFGLVISGASLIIYNAQIGYVPLFAAVLLAFLGEKES